MKNFTNLLGLTSALVTIAGAIFKRMHWQGAGILITVGIALVVCVFLPLYFFTSPKEQTGKKNPVYAIVGYFTLALLLAGALFKVMHWPGANILIQSGMVLLLIGFVPLFVVNAFQQGGKEKVGLPYIVMLLVGISLVAVIASVSMSRNALDRYLEEAISNEHSVEVVEGRTAKLLTMADDSIYAEKQVMVEKIHDQARDLQVMVSDLKGVLLESVGQPGVPIGEVKGKDIKRRKWDARADKDREMAFAIKAAEFKDMLDEMLLDPVTRSQISDHLEFTGKVWPYESGTKFTIGEPMMKSYYKLTDISKGVALTEFVAIEYILNH
jgi:hypothetical protein